MDMDMLNRQEIEGIVDDIKKLQWDVNCGVRIEVDQDMDKQAYKDLWREEMEESNRLRRVLKELLTMATLYNFWDLTSMRMALGSIKDKLQKENDKDN